MAMLARRPAPALLGVLASVRAVLLTAGCASPVTYLDRRGADLADVIEFGVRDEG